MSEFEKKSSVWETDNSWTFLTNNSHVLIYLHMDPEIRLRDVAQKGRDSGRPFLHWRPPGDGEILQNLKPEVLDKKEKANLLDRICQQVLCTGRLSSLETYAAAGMALSTSYSAASWPGFMVNRIVIVFTTAINKGPRVKALEALRFA